MEVVLALQGNHLVVLLKARKAHRALTTHEVLRWHTGKTLEAFGTGRLLRNSIVQPEKKLVVLGPDVAGEQAVHFNRRQPARQDRIGLHIAPRTLVRSPAVVAAVGGVARMTVTVVGAIAVVLAVMPPVMAGVVAVVVTVTMAGVRGAPILQALLLLLLLPVRSAPGAHRVRVLRMLPPGGAPPGAVARPRSLADNPVLRGLRAPLPPPVTCVLRIPSGVWDPSNGVIPEPLLGRAAVRTPLPALPCRGN
mmetsp:Transcript_19335/g.58116  ORF Transcript_19335/g.58116 Transcript_19335/m.58116 type:complete len:250 (-) Transcript_19335:65-814(-)